ncbi:aldo/keto reductase [Natrarchaeobius halalkaliphilus]|uniref:Aldo/keto reductase n=1 Tax=Natrarchaeobius halalkaliphilus TaxID=1679091 RepID=A0A3N6N0W5_9EURY|nr:aldo/keto reductase [Natrarchaeobius halalkaliphilus]RQG91572.1 aldo/keto reductase [Natrarchaeobius halalkaliphilus]
MNYRALGSTGRAVSEVGLGTWNIGGDWGEVSDETGREVVRSAIESGITFIDTADVYGDGRSERHIGHVLEERDAEDVFVATKAGRRLEPHDAEGYEYDRLSPFVDRSREYLGRGTLDLLQLHCPPTEAYYQPSTFHAVERLVDEGKIAHAGVSVERVEEALKAIEYDVVETIQLIFNPFRQRPREQFFDRARAEDVGVIVRVPYASGLLTGALERDQTFPENDHRNFNRQGEAFDVGETFAGIPYESGHDAVEALDPHVPEGLSLAELTLRWILDHEAVSTVIPGTTSPEHVRSNAAVSGSDPLSNRVRGAVRDVYEEHVFDHVHHRW